MKPHIRLFADGTCAIHHYPGYFWGPWHVVQYWTDILKTLEAVG